MTWRYRLVWVSSPTLLGKVVPGELSSAGDCENTVHFGPLVRRGLLRGMGTIVLAAAGHPLSFLGYLFWNRFSVS